MLFDCVLEGSGAKLPAYVGAYEVLKHRGFEVSHVAGTSGGAIIAAAMAAGYTPEEIKKFIFELNFTDFLDGGKWWTSRVWNLWKSYGMYKGDFMYEFMKDLLAQKGIHTFSDLAIDNPAGRNNPKYRWKLKVIASDITSGKILTLPDDARLYHMDPDDLEVALAIRMSMSLPFYFRPVQVNSNYIVDGGLLSNFPIWIFDSDILPACPTLGLLLQEDSNAHPFEIDSMGSFIRAIIKTMLVAHDRRFVRPGDYFHRTVAIPTGNVNTTDFDLSLQQKEVLYHAGKVSTNNFLDSWSWESYLRWAKRTRGL